MAIVNALAGIMVSDLATAAAWYEQLLSRPASNRVVFAELAAQH